jgi:hypothetical protein
VCAKEMFIRGQGKDQRTPAHRGANKEEAVSG